MNLNIKEQFVIKSTQRFVLFNISLRRHSLKCIHVPFMMLMYKKHFPFPYYCRCLMLENAHVLLCMFIVSLNLSIKVNQSFSLLNLWDIEHQFIELRLYVCASMHLSAWLFEQKCHITVKSNFNKSWIIRTLDSNILK